MSFISELNQEIVDELTKILKGIFGFSRKLPVIREIPLFQRFIDLAYERPDGSRDMNSFVHPTLELVIEILIAEGLCYKVDDQIDFLIKMIRRGLYLLATGQIDKLGGFKDLNSEEIVCHLVRRFYGSYGVPKRFAHEFPKVIHIAQWV